MIPKVIHYCWFGQKPLPKKVKRYVATWKKHCPDYDIKLWTEENFDVTAHPFMKQAYEQRAWAFVSDYARLKIIYDHGGIYLDTDVELVRNLDELLSESAFFGIQQKGSYVATGLGYGSEKENPVLKTMLEAYDGLDFDNEKKNEITCPRLNTAALKKLGYLYIPEEDKFKGEGYTVYSSEYFDPFSLENHLSEKTYSIHHYAASWETPLFRLKRMIAQFIGQDKVILIKRVIQKR